MFNEPDQIDSQGISNVLANQGSDKRPISVVAQKVRIPIQEYAAKAREKQEVFHFLSYECGVYLPPYDCVTSWFLRDLQNGKKTKVYGSEAKDFHIP